jgi:hypothetical protein
MSFRIASGMRRTSVGASRRGFSMIYVGALMLAAFGVVSLAVDLGRVRVGRLQLSTAADAAAIAGVQRLPSLNQAGDLSGPRSDAVAVGNQNVAIQGVSGATTIDLDPTNDVEFGIYRFNSGGFTPVGQAESNGAVVAAQSSNACRVTARRTAARSNPIGLFFGRAIGITNVDVVGRAVAWIQGGTTNFGFVGIDWVRFNGTTGTDSYNPADGPYGGSNVHNNGSVMSNGTISLVGTVDIHGDARPGMDFPLNQNSNSDVTGWTAPLDYSLAGLFPPPPYDPPTSTQNSLLPNTVLKGNGAFSANGVNYTFPTPPAGQTYKYVFSSMSLKSSAQVTIVGPCVIWIDSGGYDQTRQAILNISDDGPVTINCNGDFRQGGGSINNPPPGSPADFTVNMCAPATTFDISSELYAHVYAPLSDVKIHGNGTDRDFYGWIVGKTLTVDGNSSLHYDETGGSRSRPFHAALVK